MNNEKISRKQIVIASILFIFLLVVSALIMLPYVTKEYRAIKKINDNVNEKIITIKMDSTNNIFIRATEGVDLTLDTFYNVLPKVQYFQMNIKIDSIFIAYTDSTAQLKLTTRK